MRNPVSTAGSVAPKPLRILLVSPPMNAVPPRGYGGTERVVAALAEGFHAQGHDVTLIAPGDSVVACRLEPSVPTSLWSRGYHDDASPFLAKTAAMAWKMAPDFDIVHSHLEGHGFLLARHSRTPVVSTLHGRIDGDGMAALVDEFSDIPLVAISQSQRRWHPDANWLGTVHHGLPLAGMPASTSPGSYLVVVGRLTHEKGIAEAIDLARRAGMPLRIAAKMREPAERQFLEEVVAPAVAEGLVEYMGELQTAERDALFAGAYATLMLGSWPEPFGLVAIESLSAGTPVIARRAGALPEIVRHGTDGFLVDDLGEAVLATRRLPRLDRGEIRRRALERFSVKRMVDQYEAIFRDLVGKPASERGVDDLDELAAPEIVVPGRRQPESVLSTTAAASPAV